MVPFDGLRRILTAYTIMCVYLFRTIIFTRLNSESPFLLFNVLSTMFSSGRTSCFQSHSSSIICRWWFCGISKPSVGRDRCPCLMVIHCRPLEFQRVSVGRVRMKYGVFISMLYHIWPCAEILERMIAYSYQIWHILIVEIIQSLDAKILSVPVRNRVCW